MACLHAPHHLTRTIHTDHMCGDCTGWKKDKELDLTDPNHYCYDCWFENKDTPGHEPHCKFEPREEAPDDLS